MGIQSTDLPCDDRTKDNGNDSFRGLPALKPLTVTVRVARQITGLGNTTIYQLIADGILESTKIRNKRLITFQSLERLTTPPKSGEKIPPSRRPQRVWQSAPKRGTIGGLRDHVAET